ncbi:MAG: hypothetical protein ACXWQO_10320 [Bdellovibrionota bacterium]
MPLHQLLKVLFRNSIGPVEPATAGDELVTYVAYGDLQALRTELLRIKVRLEQISRIGAL